MTILPDLTTCTGDELEATRLAVLAEQERRQRLAEIPQQITALAERYVQDGGDPAAITLPA